MQKARLPKRSRLYLRNEIQALFAVGDSFIVYPLRCTHCRADKVAIMVSAPKKLFKRAVDRNAIKRRIRESYRLNQEIIEGMGIHLSISYIAKKKLPFKTINDATQEILRELRAKYSPGDEYSGANIEPTADSSC